MGRRQILLLTTAAATLPLNAAYVPQPLMPRSRAAGFGFGPSSRHSHGRTRDGAKTTVLLDSTTMDFEMNLNLPGLVTDGQENTIGGRPRKSLQVEGITEDGGGDGGDEGTMFQDLMRAVARNGHDAEASAEDAPPGAVVNLTDMPDLLSLELPTSNDGKTVTTTKPKRKAAAKAAAATEAADEDDVLLPGTANAADTEEAPKKKKKVTATIRETGQDSMKHYLKSMGNHDLLNKNEEIILAREIQILIGWEETRVDLEARLSR